MPVDGACDSLCLHEAHKFFYAALTGLIESVKQDTELARGVKDSSGSQRKHLEKLARKGDKTAREALRPKGLYPRWIGYLKGWISDLHGRSGVGMSGYAPLTYTQIEAWARLKGIRPEPHEVEALMSLDTAIRSID